MRGFLHRLRPAVAVLACGVVACLLLAGCENAADAPAPQSGASKELPAASFPDVAESETFTATVTLDAEEGILPVLTDDGGEIIEDESESDLLGHGGADLIVGFAEGDLFDSAGNPIPYTALAKGTRVEIELVGMVLETYPAQATAKKITLLG